MAGCHNRGYKIRQQANSGFALFLFLRRLSFGSGTESAGDNDEVCS
jgi:hypothetical protein